jgi:transposase
MKTYSHSELEAIAANRGVSPRTVKRWKANGRPARIDGQGARGPLRMRPDLTAEVIAELRGDGLTTAAIAERFDVSIRTVYRRSAANGAGA